jgi:hypothetical protein
MAAEAAMTEEAIRRRARNQAGRTEKGALARFDPSMKVDLLSGFASNGLRRLPNPADRRGVRRVTDDGRTDA